MKGFYFSVTVDEANEPTSNQDAEGLAQHVARYEEMVSELRLDDIVARLQHLA